MHEMTFEIRDWAVSFPKEKQNFGSLREEDFRKLPMMVARRMSAGCKAAVQVALSLLAAHDVDALIFSSRHGETVRSEKILSDIALGKDVSPTDFSMSVHNAASAMASIQSRFYGPVTSIAAGSDSFHSALIEAMSLLAEGQNRVLVVDFESQLPAILGPTVEGETLEQVYAVGLVLSVAPQKAVFEAQRAPKTVESMPKTERKNGSNPDRRAALGNGDAERDPRLVLSVETTFEENEGQEDHAGLRLIEALSRGETAFVTKARLSTFHWHLLSESVP